MNNSLFESGRSLEEAFFRKRDVELIAQHKKIEKMERTRAAMAEISGIHDPRILDKLMALEISSEVLASIAVVPLIEIAWADGHIDAREHNAVLAAAAENGMGKGTVDYDLLDHWLKHRPSARLLDAWLHYIEGLCPTMSEKECRILKGELVGRAKKVAEAAGGILGVAFKASASERAVLKKMEDVFLKHTASRKQ